MPEQLVSEAMEASPAIAKEKAPSPELKIAMVIPVYKEYDNGNIFRLLEAFRKQTLSKDQFEVVFVVNSPPNDEQGIKEEEKTGRLLDFISGKDVKTNDLFETEKQREIAQKAKEQSLSVISVDLINNPPSEQEHNIGFFRDLGTKIAIERFEKTKVGLNGIIMQFDADTLFLPRFLEKVAQRFAANPELQVLFSDFYYCPPSETTETGMKLRMDWEFCWHLARMFEVIDGKQEPKSSSQIIARASAIQKAGGVPHKGWNEDFILATNLVEQFPKAVTFDPDLKVFSVYRFREESLEGRELQIAERWLKEPTGKEPFLEIWRRGNMLSSEYDLRSPRITFASRELYQIIGQDGKSEEHIEEIVAKGEEIFARYEVPFEKKVLEGQLRSEMYDGTLAVWAYLTSLKEKGVSFIPSSIPEYTEELKAVFQENISPEEMSILEKRINESLNYSRMEMVFTRACARRVIEKWYAGSLSNEEKRFLEKNSWLKMFLNKFRKPEEIWKQLFSKYPEALGEWEKASKRQGAAVVRGIVSFLEMVKRSPREYPKTWSWMLRISKKF